MTRRPYATRFFACILALAAILAGSRHSTGTAAAPSALVQASGLPFAQVGARSTAASYRYTNLSALPGGTFSIALGLNNIGQITGYTNATDGINHAVIWQDGALTDLGTLPGGFHAFGQAINDAGQVVGAGTVDGMLRYHGFLWQNGAMTDLTPLVTALGINASGQIVGADANVHAVLLSGGVLTDLGDYGGGTAGTGINAVGQIVGYGSEPPNGGIAGPRHAFLYQDGVRRDLGYLPNPTYLYAEANAINASGQIVGYSTSSTSPQRAFLWQNGVMTALGAFPGDPINAQSVAYAINDAGQIVGQASEHAALWESGTVTNLQDFLPADWTHSQAQGINNRGQIVGNGGTVAKPNQAFLLSPPATCSVGGAAVAAAVRALATLTVSGQVVWGTGLVGTPVQGATVRIGCQTATTDASGNYTLAIDPTTDVGVNKGEVWLKVFQHGSGATATAREQFEVKNRADQPTVGNFGDHVELSANIDHVALQGLTVNNARFDANGFTITGASLKLFPAPNDAPLTVNIDYKKTGDELTIHAASGTYRWGSQSVQLTSADYHSFGTPPQGGTPDTLSVAGKVNLTFGAVGFQNLAISGARTGNTLDLHASGTVANIYGADFTFTEITLVQASGNASFHMAGSVALPNQKNAPTFDTTVADGTTTFALALRDFDFYQTPITATLRYRSANGVSELAVVGQATVAIGGANVLVKVDADIKPGDPIVKASADIDLGDKGVATLALAYQGKTQTLTGTGTLVWNVEPCDKGYFATQANGLPQGFPVGPSVQQVNLTVTLAGGQLTIVGHADLKVPCELRGQFGDLAAIDVNYVNSVASVQLSIPVKINNTIVGAFFRLEGGNGEGKVFLGLSIPFGGKVGPTAQSQGVAVRALAVANVRVLLTDPLGGKIGYDQATGQIVNTIPGAAYNGLVDGVDSFTLPGFLGAYQATLIASTDTSVAISAGGVTFVLDLKAGTLVTLGIAMAPQAGGGVAVTSVATLTLTTTGTGSVAVSPVPPTYAAGTVITLTAQPGSGQAFDGWTVDGVAAGKATTLALTMGASHTVVATFVPFAAPTFSDVPVGHPNYAAITQLAGRGIIRGYANGKFGPDDKVQRAQMAAFVVRALGWQGRKTTPRTFQDFGGLVQELQTSSLVLTNACDNTDRCVARGYDAQRFGPNDNVTYAQVITLIARAFELDPGFAWQAQPGGAQPYGGVPSVHEIDVRTYVHYVGAVPEAPDDWNRPASRAWVAQVLYQALQATH